MNDAAALAGRLRALLRRSRALPAPRSRLQRFLVAAGLVLLVFALQSFGFYRVTGVHSAVAQDNLALLRQEVTSNRLIDAALADLREFWRLSEAAPAKRRALELRETVVLRFHDEPLEVIDEFSSGAGELQADTAATDELRSQLIAKLERLSEVYADHSGAAFAVYAEPPWYLQPAATLVKLLDPAGERLLYNRALYLMLIGEGEQANALYGELRQRAQIPTERARVLFAQARLQFEAFRSTQDARFLSEALQYVRQSVRSDPQYELPKLFLDYLLAIELEATEVEAEPVEGEGSGEGEGQRGAISSTPPEF